MDQTQLNLEELKTKTSAKFVAELEKVLSYRYSSDIKECKEFEPIIFVNESDFKLMVVIRTYGSIYEFAYYKEPSIIEKASVATWYLEKLGFKGI